MRVGIIGGGNISETHARAAREIEGLRVEAVYGSNRERTGALAAEMAAVAYDDLDRFLDHGLDLVIIGSPSGRHAEQGIAAARRGLHVLVEKPIDITTERVDALLAETRRAGVQLGVCFQDRLHPEINATKAIVDAGGLGRPVMASGHVKWYRTPEYYSTSKWRGTYRLDGGGALMNQAIHTVDLLLWMFGNVRRVSGATATRLHAIEVEDTAAAVLEFESGALGLIEATTSVYPGYPRRLELTGTEGTIVIEHDRVTRTDLKSGASGLANGGAGDTNASASSARVADTRAHQRIIRDFVDAIRTGARPVCDGPDGRRSVALVEAIYASARSGQPVEITQGGA
jgi:UDP-N-acetyl-2-amino-2-deoxyglucuronate dehydrogenase